MGFRANAPPSICTLRLSQEQKVCLSPERGPEARYRERLLTRLLSAAGHLRGKGGVSRRARVCPRREKSGGAGGGKTLPRISNVTHRSTADLVGHREEHVSCHNLPSFFYFLSESQMQREPGTEYKSKRYRSLSRPTAPLCFEQHASGGSCGSSLLLVHRFGCSSQPLTQQDIHPAEGKDKGQKPHGAFGLVLSAGGSQASVPRNPQAPPPRRPTPRTCPPGAKEP